MTTHASICSGLDGPALAASWLGWRNLFHANINEFTNKILKYYYPDAKQYTDIRNADFSEWRGKVDVLTAGFPCQPFSVAGRRTGEDHDSYLWPETLRVVGEVRPRWFIGENVNGIVSMVLPGEEVAVGGQTDIFGAEASVYESVGRYIIDRICCDLEAIGYETVPVAFPACAVGAPHERMRCFFLVHDNQDERLAGIQLDEQLWEAFVAESGFDAENPLRDGWDGGERQEESEIGRQRDVSAGGDERVCGNERADASDSSGHNGNTRRPESKGRFRQARITNGGERTIADSESKRFQVGDAEQVWAGTYGATERHSGFLGWDNFPTQSPVCSRNDGLPGRLSGITFSRWRTGAISALGNAIVPQQILPILRHIELIDNYFAK